MKKYCSEIYIENFSGQIAGIERPAPMNLQKETNSPIEDKDEYRYTKKELLDKLHKMEHSAKHSAEHGALHVLFHSLIGHH